MDTNGTCCDDPKNKLHMAPSVSSAVAVMPGITTTVGLTARSTTSSMGPLFSTTPSPTLHSNQTSSSSTLSTTATTSTPDSKPTLTVGTKTVVIVLSVFGVVVLISLLFVVRAYLRRKRRLERFHRVEAGCRMDALDMANRALRANRDFARRWNYLIHRRQNPANGQQAVVSSAESAKSESAPTTVSRLASSGRNAESQLVLELLKELPYSQNEQVESDIDSAVDCEPTAELGPETLKSQQHNSTSQPPNTSNRSETLTSAQLDGTSSPPPKTDRAASLEPTLEEGSKSQGPAQNEDTSAAKPAQHLQVEDEIQRQWSWQYGDDEHLQRKRSLEEQIETKE